MKFRYLLFIILLLVFSESLFKTPLQNVSIFLKLLFILYFTYLFFFQFLFYNVNIPFYSKSYLTILFFLPLFYSFISYVIFNQSFLNGLSLNFNQFGFLIILFFLRNNYFNQNIIKKIILKTGIISFLILSIAKIYFKNNYFIVDSFMGSTRYFYSIQLISIPLISWTSFILFFDYIEKRYEELNKEDKSKVSDEELQFFKDNFRTNANSYFQQIASKYLPKPMLFIKYVFLVFKKD